MSGTTVLPQWIQRMVKDAPIVDTYLTHDSDPKYIPYASFTHWGWCEYTKRVGGAPADRSRMHKIDNSKGENKHNGYLSPFSSKKLKKAINFLVYVSKFKILSPTEKQLPFRFTVNFITLTLPSRQQHSDQFLKQECLGAFIDYMKLYHGLFAYVWKAETQDNDNLHFHIVTNVFIHHAVIRQVWNRIIEKHGYIDAYMNNQQAKFATGFKFNKNQTWTDRKTGKTALMPEKEQRRRHSIGLRSGWRNPNSTDVHAIKKVSNLGGYLATYMGKKDILKKSAPQHLKDAFTIAEKDAIKMQVLKVEHPEIFKRPITGQLWNSSMNLKVASMPLRVTAELQASMSQMQSDIAKVVFRDSYVSVTRFISGVMDQVTDDIGFLWSSFISELFPELCPAGG